MRDKLFNFFFFLHQAFKRFEPGLAIKPRRIMIRLHHQSFVLAYLQRKRRNRGRRREFASRGTWKIRKGTGKSIGRGNWAGEPYRSQWLNRARPVQYVEYPRCQRTGWLCTMGFSETEITGLNVLIDFYSWPNKSIDFWFADFSVIYLFSVNSE